MRGDQAGSRPGKKGRPMSDGATDRGRSVLAGLMAEGLGDQVLLLRIYQVSLLLKWPRSGMECPSEMSTILLVASA